jgi:ferredoxin-thioredoxin reductase catalytic chain
LSKVKKDYPIAEKKLWRCHVCNDIHYGRSAPYICPTCAAKGAFVQSDKNEALEVIGDRDGVINSKDEVIDVWKQFAGPANEFKLVEDEEMYTGLAEGVLENQKNHGLKYCPCRMMAGDPIEDLKLICPCHFEIQKAWEDNEKCWCGLFVARDKDE